MSSQLGLCWCGVAAIGVCQGGCARAVCGDHALRPDDDLGPFPNGKDQIAANLGEAEQGLSGPVRWRAVYNTAARSVRGIACIDCRSAAGLSATSAIGLIEHPPGGFERVLSAALELSPPHLEYGRLHPPYSRDNAFVQVVDQFDLPSEIVALCRARRLKEWEVADRVPARHYTEGYTDPARAKRTVRAWRIGDSDRYFSDDPSSSGTPYTAFVDGRGRFTYARGGRPAVDGLGHIRGFGGWAREWRSDLTDVAVPYGIAYDLAVALFPKRAGWYAHLAASPLIGFGDPGPR